MNNQIYSPTKCYEYDILKGTTLSGLENDDMFRYYVSTFIYNGKVYRPSGTISYTQSHYVSNIDDYTCEHYDVVKSKQHINPGEILHWQYTGAEDDIMHTYNLYLVNGHDFVENVRVEIAELEELYDMDLDMLISSGILLVASGVLTYVNPVAGGYLFIPSAAIFAVNLTAYFATEDIHTIDKYVNYLDEENKIPEYFEIYYGTTLLDYTGYPTPVKYAGIEPHTNDYLSTIENFNIYSALGEVQVLTQSPNLLKSILDNYDNYIDFVSSHR